MQQHCDICKKSPRSGNSISHSHRKTKRIFKPNLQKVSVNIEGQKQQLVVCGRCIKSL